MADVPAALSVYLRELAGRRWQVGELDCGVFMADWAVRLGARDPIADIRGCYATERQFLRIIRREGGFLACCAARLGHSGFCEASEPRAGNLVAVLAPFARRRGEIQRRPTGAIALSRDLRAVITSDLGLVIAGEVELPLLRTWEFNG
jgi:hypothetical protein